jgi:Ssp1 endopeptidase immunity protein Rap1a
MRIRGPVAALLAGLICALAAGPLPAHGQAGQPYRMRYQLSAGELAALCREDRADQAQTMQNLICAGYITGVRDGVEVGAAPSGQVQALFCPPPGFSRDDAIRIFRDYIASRSERHALPAAMVVALALKERHPCPPGPAQPGQAR